MFFFYYFIGISNFPGKLLVAPVTSLWPPLFPLVANCSVVVPVSRLGNPSKIDTAI